MALCLNRGSFSFLLFGICHHSSNILFVQDYPTYQANSNRKTWLRCHALTYITVFDEIGETPGELLKKLLVLRLP